VQVRRLSANIRKGDSDSQAFFMGVNMASSAKLLFGVGINDSGYVVNPIVNGARSADCKFYQAWQNMLQRCYSKRRHARNPSYKDCRVCEEWLSFSAFKAWMETQDWIGKHLNKDTLMPGNKIYSRDTCVFIDQNLNKFLCDAGAIRGEWPIGVCWAKREEKFLARCCDPFDGGKNKFLGYFDCPNLAHAAWRSAKHRHALRYADMQPDKRVAEAIRTRYLSNKEAS